MDKKDYYQKKFKNKKVLEIASGYGLPGIYLAKKMNAKVTATDIDKEVFPFLNYIAEENGVSIKTKKASYGSIKDPLLGQHDVIIGSDLAILSAICFASSSSSFDRSSSSASSRALLCQRWETIRTW